VLSPGAYSLSQPFTKAQAAQKNRIAIKTKAKSAKFHSPQTYTNTTLWPLPAKSRARERSRVLQNCLRVPMTIVEPRFSANPNPSARLRARTMSGDTGSEQESARFVSCRSK
jgi:hypothetical protein